MKRTITQYLIEWKEREDRKPLILRGARQVGKTYTIDEFGKSHFVNAVKINLEERPELKKIFFNSDVNRIITELSILSNEDINYGKTLLFIDEIQTCPEALLALRYFDEKLPDLHVICAGSLLDHTLNEMESPMPVGRVEFLYMYPMNFKEFLRAINQEKLISYIEEYDFIKPFSELIHNQISQFLRFYFFIGGMPAAVKNYAENKKLPEIQRIHANILTSLQYDFAKYGTRKKQEYLQITMRYCGRYPGRKIKYSNIDKEIRSTFIKEAILKLELSRIIHVVAHSNSAKVPLTDHLKKEVYKTIFMDIGFVNHLSQIDLIDLEDLITSNEGMLAEQFVAQELIANRDVYMSPELYYWTREEKSSNAEVDFLFQNKNKIYPIEVKAGKTGTLKSMQVYLHEKKLKQGVRLNLDIPNYGDFTSNVRVKNKASELKWSLLSLPVYMVSEIKRLIDIKF
jgi:predicted AAA+ superfamily ATPase